MKNLILFVSTLCVLVASCNPAKKLAKQQKQFVAVVDEYNKNYPARVDTNTIYVQGDNVVTIELRTDTLIEYLFDTIAGKTITVQKYILGKNYYYTRVDTIIKTVENTTQINLLKKLNTILEHEKSAAITNATNNLKWLQYFIISALVNLLFAFIIFKTTTKKLK